MTVSLSDLPSFVAIAFVAIVAFAILLFLLQSHADKAFGRGLKMKRRRFLPTPGSTDPTAHTASPYLEPRRATADAAGYDIFHREEFILEPGVPKLMATGLFLEIPEGLVGLLRPRSSAAKVGIHVTGTIDSDYRGEISVVATNLTKSPIIIPVGKAIAQLILVQYASLPIVQVDTLSSSVREDRGFGSSGNSVK